MSLIGMVNDYVRKQKEQQAAQGECCSRMRAELEVTCDQHERLACPDVLVYRAASGYTGLRIHDGGSSTVQIAYCPWCGARLQWRRSTTTTAERSSPSSSPDSRLGGEAGKEKPVPVESLLDAEDYAVMAMDDDEPSVVVEGE